jgi:hypothetical protein
MSRAFGTTYKLSLNVDKRQETRMFSQQRTAVVKIAVATTARSREESANGLTDLEFKPISLAASETTAASFYCICVAFYICFVRYITPAYKAPVKVSWPMNMHSNFEPTAELLNATHTRHQRIYAPIHRFSLM